MNYLKSELLGWKKWEISWLVIACAVIVSLSIYWQDTIVGIISATSGVICVVLTGKGKLSAYIFGGINTLLYGYIAYQSQFYGEVMLNILYYFPMQFYGFYIWRKNIDNTTGEVIKRSLTPKWIGYLFAIVGISTLVYGYILTMINGNLAYVDAFSTVVSVVAMIVSIKRYSQQWLLWILVNVVTIFMWAYAFFIQGGESIATLLMWCIYLINAVIMYAKWRKEAA